MSTLKKSALEFHHGNLKASLIAAGVKQVGRHGLNSLSLRQLSLTTGVSQTAAYRHFKDLEHLKAEVSKAAREALGALMFEKLKKVKIADPKQAAINRLWESGAAYIEFAIRHPNLFEIAFITYQSPELEPENPSPWGILNNCLDNLWEEKLISNALRSEAPVIAWSMVHGFAGLAAQGFSGSAKETQDSTKIVLNSVLRSLGIK
jgi:AcrR family transcriptional regulator